MTGRILNHPLRLLPINIGLVCLFLTLGMVLPGHGSRLDLSAAEVTAAHTPVDDLLAILQNNYKLAGLILCGVFTFGLYPVVLLCANALVLGADLVTIVRTNPNELRYLFPFLPQEFLGLCLAASVAESFGWRFFRHLFLGEAFGPFRAGLWFISMTVVLIALAAVSETLCKYSRNNGIF